MRKQLLEISKKNILQAIVEIKGKRSNAIVHKYKPDTVIDFSDEGISLFSTGALTNKKKNMFFSCNYCEVSQFELSICKRNYGTIAGVLVNEYHIIFLFTLHNGQSFEIESASWQQLLDMVVLLKNNNVIVCDLLDIYNNYSNRGKEYLSSLDQEFDIYTDKYNLKSYSSDFKR